MKLPIPILFCSLCITVIDGGCSSSWKYSNYSDDAEYKRWKSIPNNIMWIYGHADHPLKQESFDSLVRFAVSLDDDSFLVFKGYVRGEQREQKYLRDFALAFDGDTLAFGRAAASISGADEFEAFFIINALGNIDRARTINVLEKVVWTETNGFHRDYLDQQLKWQKRIYNEDNNHLIPDYQKRLNNTTDAEIEDGLTAGTTDKILLEAGMRSKNASVYQRTRELLVRRFDSLAEVNQDAASDLVAWFLMLPAPGDTIDDSAEVKEIFNGVFDGSICRSSYFSSDERRELKADTLRFWSQDDPILIQPRFAYLTLPPGEHGRIDPLTDSELVSRTQWEGRQTYRCFDVSVYRGFARAGVGSAHALPFWTMMVGHGAARKPRHVTLQRVDAKWKIIGDWEFQLQN